MTVPRPAEAESGRAGRHCPTCGAATTPDLRFCLTCGSALTPAACPTCGTPRVAGARFCGQCGSRLDAAGDDTSGAVASASLAASAASPGGTAASPGLDEPARATERRLVSILFADLVGFTARSEDEDPEQVREFLSTYFERASEVIGRYGGNVEKFIGDAVMAVWGTPTAHEDDAERAVRAALDLVAMAAGLGHGVALRAGVTTGEAAVDPSAQSQRLVAGDLVNTSSRLQAVATPGTVVVDETTMIAAGRAVAFDASGEVTLKGKGEPLKTWVAMRVVAQRGGAGRREGLEPPFVGRDEELRLLKDSLHATAREGRSRLVSVIGQAGFGKSRLAWELKKYSDGLAETIFWHEGETPAYGGSVAYWALGGMVRWRCRIDDGDGPDVAREKLARTVAEFIADAEERAWIEPRLSALLGLAEVPSGDREELFAAWRAFFERIAAQGTVALIFEDLHWADEGLFDFIDQLLEWSRDYPILVVGLARPELLARRPGWGSGHRAAVTVHLEPLSDVALGDLLRGLVPGLPEPTLAAVVTRAEGVPLYAVETIRMLLDSGRLVREGERYRLRDPQAEVAVPASLQALVSARLDALDPSERSLVQDASVLGKSFGRAALAAVSGHTEPELEGPLGQLVRKEVVALERSRATGSRAQYEFVQSILRDVAYSTLSRRDRRQRHLAAADYFASLDDEELAGIVATHLLDAYQAMPDDEESQAVRDRARLALRAAAERSIALHANQAAVTFIEQALTVTDEPEERAHLWVMITEPARAAVGAEAADRYVRQAVDWYLANDRDEEADEAIAILASWMVHSQVDADVLGLVGPRVARLDDATAGPTAPRLLNELARAYLFSGQSDEAIVALDRGLAIAERLTSEPAMAELFTTKSWAVGLLGRPHESMLFAEGGLALAERNGMVLTQLRTRMNLSDLYIAIDPRRAYEIAAAGVELAERVGHASWAAGLGGNETFAALLLGEWDRPLERVRQLQHPSLEGFGKLALLLVAAVVARFRGQPPPPGWDPETAAEGVAQGKSIMLVFRTLDGFAAGELSDLDRFAAGSFEGGSTHPAESTVAMCLAANGAIWLGDRGRLATIVERLETDTWVGLIRAQTVRQAQAALAAMDGAVHEPVAEYRQVVEAWRHSGLRLFEVVALMEMLKLFGQRLPDHDELAVRTRAMLRELGAVTLLARLDELAPVAPLVADTAAVPTGA